MKYTDRYKRSVEQHSQKRFNETVKRLNTELTNLLSSDYDPQGWEEKFGFFMSKSKLVKMINIDAQDISRLDIEAIIGVVCSKNEHFNSQCMSLKHKLTIDLSCIGMRRRMLLELSLLID